MPVWDRGKEGKGKSALSILQARTRGKMRQKTEMKNCVEKGKAEGATLSGSRAVANQKVGRSVGTHKDMMGL